MIAVLLLINCIVAGNYSNTFDNTNSYNDEDTITNPESDENDNEGDNRLFNPFQIVKQVTNTPLNVASNTFTNNGGGGSGGGDGNLFDNFFNGVVVIGIEDTKDYRPNQELNYLRPPPPSFNQGSFETVYQGEIGNDNYAGGFNGQWYNKQWSKKNDVWLNNGASDKSVSNSITKKLNLDPQNVHHVIKRPQGHQAASESKLAVLYAKKKPNKI